MKKEELFNIIGEVDEQKVAAAGMAMNTKKKSRPVWVKWGAMAACLCLVVGVTLLSSPNQTPYEENVEIDGVIEMDPIVADLAVFPESESITNVVDVTMDSVYEADIYNVEDLGKHLPTAIPEGYCFGSAALYKTTMNDGTVYRCLSTNYSFNGRTTTGECEEEIMMLDYRVSVMNFKPKTAHNTYTIDNMPNIIAENDIFILEVDDIFIEITSGNLTYDEIMLVLGSIQCN